METMEYITNRHSYRGEYPKKKTFEERAWFNQFGNDN